VRVLIPIPEQDFDPTEVAVSWQVLKRAGFEVVFATPYGVAGRADDVMLTGEGLDPWGRMPGLKRLVLIGRMLRADRHARSAYRLLIEDEHFLSPLDYAHLHPPAFDALLLPGGHRARGMRNYLESASLQAFVGKFFATGKPVAAICHGVVLAARSRAPRSQHSVLYGRKTTALPWSMERAAWNLTRWIGRVWDPDYYRTYVEAVGETPGARSVEMEVKSALRHPADFIGVRPGPIAWLSKSSGMFRDAIGRKWPAHVVVDDQYVSARWPGDAHTFALTFVDVIRRFSHEGVVGDTPGPVPSTAR
jgi:putative intracellular protease/amidase